MGGWRRKGGGGGEERKEWVGGGGEKEGEGVEGGWVGARGGGQELSSNTSAKAKNTVHEKKDRKKNAGTD